MKYHSKKDLFLKSQFQQGGKWKFILSNKKSTDEKQIYMSLHYEVLLYKTKDIFQTLLKVTT